MATAKNTTRWRRINFHISSWNLEIMKKTSSSSSTGNTRTIPLWITSGSRENTRMKLSKYRPNGRIQRRGMEAMSVVI